MKRPEHWYQLTATLAETIADNTELEYDSYESSHAEALHSLLCDPPYHDRNNRLVQERYKSISDEELTAMIKRHISSLQYQIDSLNELLNQKNEN